MIRRLLQFMAFKRKNREINIFSMSALDLFASGMGAFIIIAVIALSYYLKTNPDLIEQVNLAKTKLKKERLEHAAAKTALAEVKERLQRKETEAKAAQAELKK